MEEVMTKAMKTITDSSKETEKMFVELEDKWHLRASQETRLRVSDANGTNVG